MAYTKTIDRKNPSCILFLIDRSGSMADPISGAFGKRKANAVADAVNRLLSDLIIKCTKGEGIRYYYDVGVIGYGSDPKGFADLVTEGALPKARADRCPWEWKQISRPWERLLAPFAIQ